MLAIPIFPFLKFMIYFLIGASVSEPPPGALYGGSRYILLGERERAHLVVQLARFFIVRVARYRIASKCFYALLFRRPRGEKYLCMDRGAWL